MHTHGWCYYYALIFLNFNIDNLTASAAPQVQKDNIPSHQSDDPVLSVINNATWLDSWERMNASI